MKWIKQGLIYEPKNDFLNSFSHATIPVPDLIDEDLLRIYFSYRDKKGRSHPTFIEVNPVKPKEILNIKKEPLFPVEFNFLIVSKEGVVVGLLVQAIKCGH